MSGRVVSDIQLLAFGSCLCNIYNIMSGRVLSDIQTRAEGEWLYILCNADANVEYSL